MNKKGIFLPLFVLSVFIILGLLYSTIIHEKNKRENSVIGEQAASLLKVYDEQEKINFFLEQALKYSEKKALSELYNNGGYREKNNCEKSGNYVIFDSSCGEFNPEKYFQEILKEEMNLYKYKSTYKEIEYNEVALTPIFRFLGAVPKVEKTQRDFKSLLENEVNNAKISTELKDNYIVIDFTPIKLTIEDTTVKGSLESAYSFNPEFKINNNIIFLENFHKQVSQNCKKSLEECEFKLKELYSNINIAKEEKMLKINIINNNYELKVAVDPERNFPGKTLFS